MSREADFLLLHKIDKVNRSRFPSNGKITIVDRNPYVGGCSFHAAGHITHEHPGYILRSGWWSRLERTVLTDVLRGVG